MEVDNTLFQDLESVGKERVSKVAMEKLWIFCGRILEYHKMDLT